MPAMKIYELPSRVVNNHVIVLNPRRLVFLRNVTESVEEQTITKLHDVGLVDASDLLPVVCEGERERKLGDALRLCAGDDLEGLDNAGDGLVLQTGVLAFGVLSDEHSVDVFIRGLKALDGKTRTDIGEKIEGSTKHQVKGDMTLPN